MIIEKTGTQTTVGGVKGKPSTFAIKSSATAFNILSSKLYNDKITAIIRELSCNAWDSHVEAGKPNTPFEINLPTYIDPVFRVKDFGVGMSDEQVLELYCTYFASSKDTRNDLIGAMGLGSKSPFCYTDGFDVVSVYGGVKRTYNAHLSEEGTPEAICTSESATVEPNGVEISFPVDPKDFDEFENKAKRVLEFFEPTPKVNLPDFTVEKREYTVRGENWGIRKEMQSDTHQYVYGSGAYKWETNGGTKARAIMGNVPYSIGNIDESKLSASQKNILRMPVDLFFNIGELEVSASRESLSNTKHTITNILARLDEVEKHLISEMRNKVESCENLWQAKLLIWNWTHSGDASMKHIVETGALKGVYGKFSLMTDSLKVSINEMDYTALNIETFWYKYGARRKANKSWLFKRKDTEAYAKQLELIASDEKRVEELKHFVEIKPERIFVFNDLIGTKDRPDKYIFYLLQEDQPSKVRIDNASPIKEIWLFTLAQESKDNLKMIEEMNQLVELLGNPPVINLSSLKEKYDPIFAERRAARPKVPRKARGVLVLNSDGLMRKYRRRRLETYSYARNWEKATEIPDGIKFFVELDYSHKPTDGEFSSCEQMVNFYDNVRQTKFLGLEEDTPIFGLKKGSKLIGKPDWVNLFDYVKEWLPEIMTVEKQQEMTLFWKSFIDDNLYEYLGENIDKLITKSTAKKFVEKYLYCLKALNSDDYKSLFNVVTHMRVLTGANYIVDEKNFIDFAGLYDKVLFDYPMLTVIYNWSKTKRELNVILQYVIQCDEVKYSNAVTVFVGKQPNISNGFHKRQRLALPDDILKEEVKENVNENVN